MTGVGGADHCENVPLRDQVQGVLTPANTFAPVTGFTAMGRAGLARWFKGYRSTLGSFAMLRAHAGEWGSRLGGGFVAVVWAHSAK
jgi:hypothetical protein